MRIPGSIYKNKKGDTYVALYNYWADVYRKAPPEIRKMSDYVAHIKYSFGGNSRGIDVFLLYNRNYDISDEVDVKRTLRESKSNEVNRNLKAIDKRHNLIVEIAPECDVSGILNLIRKDIKDFARRPAKKHSPSISLVDKIVPKTKLRKIKQKEYLRRGKQEFVPSCALDVNLDFSWGCISGFIPSPNAHFDGKYFRNYFLDIWAECGYCYAVYQHKSFAKYILDIDKKQLIEELEKEKKAKARNIVLRLGKRTEAGSKFTLDSLVTTLEACIETGTRAIIPTKYLEFDKEIAGLLKKSKSVVLYSIGWDKLEKGACIHGYPNEWRIEQALRYKKENVNSVLYLHINLPHKMTERERGILNFAFKDDLPIQLLSIRIPSKRIAKEITGSSWEELKTSNGQLLLDIIKKTKNHGGYKWKTNIMIAQEKHEDYKFLIGQNNYHRIRMCHHDDKETYCGRCFLDDKGSITPTVKLDIKYMKKSRKDWKKPKNHNGSLFEHI
ncbi:MAG: hypothetical protein IB618_01135 [Candidatus Pacearchaeota archaeon]|nr:MAG: hypothetical protein IB618_01135 [Candidatus Pacearchaeota archaeon]